jgi:hypothetical protein
MSASIEQLQENDAKLRIKLKICVNLRLNEPEKSQRESGQRNQ